MKKAQPEHLYPGIAKTALSTIKLYLGIFIFFFN